MQNLNSSMWDQKQKNYPKFDPNDCEFEKNILAICNEFGVDFANKTILEVGCGTGKYTMLLAENATRVDALDFSKNMLKSLEKSAQQYGLSGKINCILADFSTFNTKEKYDVLFAAMTPAISSEFDYSKLPKFARHFVYLGWGGARKSRVMDEVFAAHSSELKTHEGATKLKKWLDEENIEFKSKSVETSWKQKLSIDDMIENEAWHLKMHGLTPDLSVIREILTNLADADGFVIDETKATLELIVW